MWKLSIEPCRGPNNQRETHKRRWSRYSPKWTFWMNECSQVVCSAAFWLVWIFLSLKKTNEGEKSFKFNHLSTDLDQSKLIIDVKTATYSTKQDLWPCTLSATRADESFANKRDAICPHPPSSHLLTVRLIATSGNSRTTPVISWLTKQF